MTAARAPQKKRPVRVARASASEAEQKRLERKSARQGRRKDEIVQAAVALAATLGVDGFTAEDVGKALAMSTPSVFYYFPGGLAELRASVALRRFYARLDPTVRLVEAAPDGVTALTSWIRGLARCYAEDPDGLGTDIEIMQRGAWGPELVQAHVAKLNALFTTIERKLDADRAAGKLHPGVENLRRMAMLMNQISLGLVVGDQLRRKVGGGSRHAFDGLVDDLCGIIERGVRRSPPERLARGRR